MNLGMTEGKGPMAKEELRLRNADRRLSMGNYGQLTRLTPLTGAELYEIAPDAQRAPTPRLAIWRW